MLPEMIVLHQKRHKELNPHESIEIERRRDDLTFEDMIALEQEVDNNGLTALDYLERATTIAITYDREQLEIWAAEKHLGDLLIHETEEETKNKPPPKNNVLTYQQLKEQIQETVTLAGTGTIQKYAYRAIKKAHQNKQALPVQLEGYACEYQLVELGEIMHNEKQPSAKNCLYQKIYQFQQHQDRSTNPN